MLAAVAVATSACNVNDELAFTPIDNTGSLDIACEVSPSVNEVDATRAGETTSQEGFTLPQNLTALVELFNASVEGAKATSLDDVLAMRITGKYIHPKEKVEKSYNGTWNSITNYIKENVKLDAGKYEVRIESKPQTEVITVNEKNALKVKEGENNPYFVYESEKEAITIQAMEFGTKHEAVLKLANSCFTLKVDESLLRYYTDLKLTISTRDGAEFTFKPELPTSSGSTSTGGASTASSTSGTMGSTGSTAEEWTGEWSDGKLYFFNVGEVIEIQVPADYAVATADANTAALYLKGHGTRQTGRVDYFTKDGTAAGDAVKINPVKDENNDGTPEPQPLANGTHYTITVGHSTAGGGALNISYEGYDEQQEIDIEVNLRPDDMDDPDSGEDDTTAPEGGAGTGGTGATGGTTGSTDEGTGATGGTSTGDTTNGGTSADDTTTTPTTEI